MSFVDKMQFWKKSEDERDDVSIIDEYKEPFSWQGFWDEQVVGRVMVIRGFLKEKGILFFFMSPFQYKNRLVFKLVLIVFGVLVGVVPRTMNIIEAARERNEGSQLANVDAEVMTGNMTVEPLVASQYEQTHILAFDIEGETSDGVPSTTDGFTVDLLPSRGVTGGESVQYRYRVLPVSSSNRLLLVYVDTREHEDKTGIYDLDIHVATEEPMEAPLEIVLSDAQETTPIYGESGINLASLSEYMTGMDGEDTRIQEAEDELDNALSIYQTNEERLLAMDMEIGFTTEDMLDYVGEHLVLNEITDQSTTKDTEDLTLPEDLALPEIVSTITYDERTFRGDEELQDADIRTYRDVTEELTALSSSVSDIQAQIQNVNSVRTNKFDELDRVANTLNQQITVDTFTEPQGIVE